ncbi:NUDIX domain [Halomonadaceae bacterium LMG 33818]|uniref:NUDIX hydrolase n=1 Tax=Cernens ardua TaxID=3402176 RepID=UPI003EDC35D2
MSYSIPVRCSSIVLYLVRLYQGAHQVLLLQRKGGHLDKEWSHLAGGMEEGENAWQTALREAQEETGIVLTNLYTADICEQYYRQRKNLITVAPVFVSYIERDATITLNEEHYDYQWLAIEEAYARLNYPCQRQSLRHIEKEFLQRRPTNTLRII